MNPAPTEIIGAVLFGIALIHTFSTKFFERLAHTHPAHAGIWHFLGEVEVVFGFWAMVLVVAMLIMDGKEAATAYLDRQSFTEPMFVFAIMVISGSRPILQFAMTCVKTLARLIPWPAGKAFYFVTLSFVPLLGSFITEPAAMTLAGLILLERYYSRDISVAPQICHSRRAFRQHLHRRNNDVVCGAPGSHGGRQMGMGYNLHVHHLRLESCHSGNSKRFGSDFAVSERAIGNKERETKYTRA